MTNKQIQRPISQQDKDMAEVNRLAQRWVAAQQVKERKEAVERAAIVKRIDQAIVRQLHLHRMINQRVAESMRRIQVTERASSAASSSA